MLMTTWDRTTKQNGLSSCPKDPSKCQMAPSSCQTGLSSFLMVPSKCQMELSSFLTAPSKCQMDLSSSQTDPLRCLMDPSQCQKSISKAKERRRDSALASKPKVMPKTQKAKREKDFLLDSRDQNSLCLKWD